MIQLEAITKAYGGQTLFRELSWRITEGERIGLVGPNGAGKTTLCRILAGIEEPDAGRVTRDRGTTIGRLPRAVGRAVGRRADARRPGPPPPAPPVLAAPRRADEPPRPRVPRLAGG